MSHLTEWQELYVSYGIAIPAPAPFFDDTTWPWGSRHVVLRNPGTERVWCRCPGMYPHSGCSQVPTQEDLLCDECRTWCVAGDGRTTIHLADLP